MNNRLNRCGRTSSGRWATWPCATSPSSSRWSRPGSRGCSTGPGWSTASSPAPGSTSPLFRLRGL